MSKKNGLINFINIDDVHMQIYLTRKKFKNRPFALVEGTNDVGFYKGILNKDNLGIIPMGTKENVVQAIKKFNSLNLEGVIAIIDSDYDRLLGKEVEEKNTIITDTHDIETMILKTDAYEKFENEYGDDEKIQAFIVKQETDVLSKVLELGSDIGKIRLISMRDDLRLDFSSVHISDYFDRDLKFDIANYFKQLLYVSNKKTDIEKNSIQSKYSQEKENNDYDIWELCRGHDLSEIITILFSADEKNTIGNNKAQRLKQETVEAILRAAYYAPVHFIQTKMFDSLVKWQIEHPKWQILKGTYINQVA